MHDVYGPPEVLRVEETDRPVPGEGEVLVQVHAAGVDPGVWHLTAGLPYLIRAAGFGLRAPNTGSGAWTSPGGWRRSAPASPGSSPATRCTA
ncbi:hypothetical protein ACFQ0T_01245 [Kitasatospora gansuensis]